MHSNAINDSLSHILKSPITYITLVTHNEGKEYFLCIGSHSFFIIDSKLDDIEAEIFYAHVQRVVVDTSKNKLLLIQLSDNRTSNVPGKLILKTENRRALTDQLKAAWKTDYMFRLGTVLDLPVFQGEVYSTEFKNSAKTPQVPSYLLEPMQQWDKHEFRRYGFYIPSTFRKRNQNDNTFYQQSAKNKFAGKISIQVSEYIPLDALNYMDGREDINVYCEEYAIKLVANEPKVWIMSSRSYCKRYNLNQDIACWQGWEVRLRTPKKDILVILLRRKYIPPLLDYFVDFVVVVEGAEKSTAGLAKLAPSGADFHDTATILSNGRRVADSFHATFTTTTIYEAFIQRRVDSLYYDEETMSYLQYRTPNKIRSNATLYGVAFIINILRILSKYDPNVNIVVDILNERYADDLEKGWLEEWDPFDPPEWETVRKALEEKLVPYKKKKGEDNDSWDFKVSKYFAFCVDGGMLNFFFTLNVIVECYLAHSNEANGEKLNTIILYLLHFKPERQKEMSDYETSLANKIYEMLYSKEKYVFNEKVMVNLLAAGYFKKELGGSDKPLLYSKFLTYMLEHSTNPFVKSAICKQINQDQNEKKASATNIDINLAEVKSLVRPLLTLYQGENFRLATLAVVALASLCSKTREIKQFIMQEGDDIILQQLDAKDEDLLLFTLRLLEYLMLVSQNVTVFIAKGVITKIVSILEGSGIVGVFYSDKILTLTCQILSIIASNVEEHKRLITNNVKLIMAIFDLPRDKPISDPLVCEIMNLFMIRIIDKDKQAIETIGEHCLDVFLDKLKSDFFKTTDLQNRILTFLLGFKDSERMMTKLREANIAYKIQEYLNEHKKKATTLLREIEGPLGKKPNNVPPQY